ncbi:MAG: glycerophosphodiester phosphodiesterase family protein [Leptospira sp.]|nr:glycerophosphodiester phosphodiesterase family protein [Leptospira sp.]
MHIPRKKELQQLFGPGTTNIGHRGTRGLAPENTLISFQKAYEFTKFFELDTMNCGTGELVVIHDDSVNRTTNGLGLVSELPLSQIQSLDAGSFFNKEFAGIKIPTLKEVLTELPKDAIFDIEVKSQGNEKHRSKLAKALVSLVHSLSIQNRIFISSFDEYLLEKVKLEDPDLLRGQLLDVSWDEKEWKFSEPDLILPNHESVSKTFMNHMRDKDYMVLPYTVNKREDWKRLISLGVKGIITDRPDQFGEYLLEVSKGN